MEPKKEKTWCGALVESCSQIKYSLSFFALFADQEGSGSDGAIYNTDRGGNPNVFNLERNDNGSWLNNNWANPDNKWNPRNEFVFRLRQSFLSARLRCLAVFLIRVIQTFLPATEHFSYFLKFHGDILE